MLEIHKIKNDEIIKNIATEAKLSYTIDDTFLGVFIDGEVVEFLTYSQFEKNYNIIYISDKSNDFQLILGLLKTIIFIADMNIIHSITLPLCYERIAKAIGFDKIEDMYILNVLEYHTKSVKCC